MIAMAMVCVSEDPVFVDPNILAVVARVSDVLMIVLAMAIASVGVASAPAVTGAKIAFCKCSLTV